MTGLTLVYNFLEFLDHGRFFLKLMVHDRRFTKLRKIPEVKHRFIMCNIIEITCIEVR